MNQFENNRQMMKSNFNILDSVQSDQNLNLPQPPLEKEFNENSLVIQLPKANNSVIQESDIFTCIKKRRSHRRYIKEFISLEELAFLLWATQGVQRVFGKNYATYRTVPSGGARHPFETYLAIHRVTGIEPGIYRYLSLSHRLVKITVEEYDSLKIGELANEQNFVSDSAVVFIWSCIPYRGEWRYHLAAHKTMLIDAGHLCQNLYIAAGAINCGACAIGAYNQEELDQYLGLDGEEEFTVYMATVGKV